VLISGFLYFILDYNRHVDIVALCCFMSEIDRRESRVHAMRSAIQDTFPEPNRRLLQRYTLSHNPGHHCVITFSYQAYLREKFPQIVGMILKPHEAERECNSFQFYLSLSFSEISLFSFRTFCGCAVEKI